MSHISLNTWILELPSNQALRIIDSVGRITCSLVFSRLPDQPFSLCKSDIRGSGALALRIFNNLNAITLPNSDARKRSAQINSDHWRSLACTLTP
mmetsp:Transcript_57998/g.166309  ORF Transcript_57998/g.166309 Transcript_57998/m.166309 type:complete len:95 (+) Transcript_57998:1773-2057(+)